MTATGHEPSPLAERDGWSHYPHLTGLRHGHFHQAPELAARLQAAPAEDDIRFRGERLTVHTVDDIAYAVLWEEWFSPTASTWVQHASPAAARSWTHQLAANWLRREVGCSHGNTLQSWDGGSWAAERDLITGRWHLAIGLEPGVTYASIEAEDQAVGWAFLTDTLTAAGFPTSTWPPAMRQVRLQDLPDPDPAVPLAAAPEPPPRPRTWHTELLRLLARLLASLRRIR